MSARDGNNPWLPFLWLVLAIVTMITVGYEVSK
jgi:hypothetical protein